MSEPSTELPGGTTDLFHLSGVGLRPGSVIAAGNFGRVLLSVGWRHSAIWRELALEEARRARYPSSPSRLRSAFAFLSREEALRFKRLNSGAQVIQFDAHVLYRVRLVDPGAATLVTDWRAVSPNGDPMTWVDRYWANSFSAAVPGVQGADPEWELPHREVLTLSHLKIEERLDPA